MTDLLIRGIWIGVLAGIAVGAGLFATRVRRSSQRPVDVSGLGFDSALVAFTSTDCANCKKVMGRLSTFDVPVREVTYELEPGLFERAGIEGVPLVVVLNRDGSPSTQFGGALSGLRLRRALRRAGW